MRLVAEAVVASTQLLQSVGNTVTLPLTVHDTADFSVGGTSTLQLAPLPVRALLPHAEPRRAEPRRALSYSPRRHRGNAHLGAGGRARAADRLLYGVPHHRPDL